MSALARKIKQQSLHEKVTNRSTVQMPSTKASTKVRSSSAGLKERCHWAQSPIMIAYHDLEWGVPVEDDRTFFEFLILEGAQAGLSWETVLNKRQRYRELFDNFDPAVVARYHPSKVSALMQEAGIIRNQLKITSAIENAKSISEGAE